MYCTVDDIVRAIGVKMLIDLSNSNGQSKATQIDNDTVVDLIKTQSSYIDAYLSGRYLLPLAVGADLNIMNNICIILVIDELYARRLIELPETFLIRKKSAIADLEKISKGIILLQSNRAVINGGSSNQIRSVSKRKPIFTDETLRNII